MARKTRWIVTRSIWPYDDGWAVCSSDKSIVLDVGLETRAEAALIAAQMNREEVKDGV